LDINQIMSLFYSTLCAQILTKVPNLHRHWSMTRLGLLSTLSELVISHLSAMTVANGAP
jgi:hypothetical protein